MGGLKDFFGGGGGAGALGGLAISTLLPSVGGAIGGGINDALGLGLGETAQQAIGNAVAGGGLGYLTGGGSGALTGALVGGITPYAASALGLGGGLAGSLPTMAQGGVGPDIPKVVDSSGGSGGGALSALTGGSSGGALSKALPLMLGLGLAASSMGGKKDAGGAPQVTPEHQAALDQQNKGLSQVKWTRPKATFPTNEELKNYGRGGEHVFFKDNKVPEFADGGDVDFGGGGALAVTGQGALDPMMGSDESRYFVGPGAGRDDFIDAKVSNNEYVFDAEVVALLGDGSPDAGAARLDEMRKNIRRHKGGALAVGEISPNALPPEAYLPQGAL